MTAPTESFEEPPRPAPSPAGFGDFVQVVVESIPVIIVLLALGVLLGLSIQSTTPRAYESQAKFVIDKLPYTGGKEDVDAETERQLIQTIILSIPSRDMARSVESRLDVGAGRIVFPELDIPLKLTGREPEANIHVEAIRESRIGEITAISQNAEFAANAANAVLDEIQLYNVIGGQLATLREDLLVAHTLADNLLTQLSEASTQKIKLERQNAELDSYVRRGIPLESFPAFVEDGTLNNLKTQLMLVQSEYDGIASTATRGARLEAKRTELAGLKSQLGAYVQELVEALRSEFEIAKTQEADIQKNLHEESLKIDRMSEKAAELTQSFADPVKMRKFVEEIRGESTGPASVIVPINRAVPQFKPVRPKLWLNLLLGIVFGSALSGAIIGARFYLDNRVKSARQLEQRAGIPVLTLLPRHTPLYKGTKNRSIFDHSDYPVGLNFLRSEFLRGRGRVLGFSSVDPGWNASDLVASLAILLAQAEKRTLIIDLHLNAPRHAAKLGIRAKTGLAEWLASDGEPIDDFIGYSALRELAVLGPVAKHRDIDDLLSRRPLLAIMPELLEKWDFILVDSPPILADWSMLLTLPQGSPVIFCARHRRATIEQFTLATERAIHESWRVKGAVLQNCPKSICPSDRGS